FLAEKCRETNSEISFTYSDIKNALSDKPKMKVLDTTHLFQYLADRQKSDPNLGFDLDRDDDQKLCRVFFVFKGGQELWSNMGSRLVLFDTKHGTNTYGFKLGLFVTVDENGKTRIVAGSFVKQEDVASFEWVFKQWDKFMHGKSPAVIFTDSDKSMASAVKKVWGTSIKHFLCTYHLSKNFHQHIKPLFSKKAWKNYKKAKSIFWKLCLETDEQSKLTFDKDWEELVAYIRVNSDSSSDKVSFHSDKIRLLNSILVFLPEYWHLFIWLQVDQQIKWLEMPKAKKEVWIGRYTWTELTFGVHSTQRIEAIHSSVARFCKKSHPLLVITKKLENLADELALKSGTEAARAEHRRILSGEGGLLRMIREMSHKVTAYAIDMICAQASQHVNYSAVSMQNELAGNDAETYSVCLTDESKQMARQRSKDRAKQWSLAQKSKKKKGSSPVQTTTVGPARSSEGRIAAESLGDRAPTEGVCQIDEGRINLDEKDCITTLTKCSCQFATSRGLPCRHMFCVAQVMRRNYSVNKVIIANMMSHVDSQFVQHIF
ncbi:MAG: hypothetical protein ACREOZ_04005, partial [Gloeomargaritales cyanobacterium]